jgi:hypothetical protein
VQYKDTNNIVCIKDWGNKMKKVAGLIGLINLDYDKIYVFKPYQSIEEMEK